MKFNHPMFTRIAPALVVWAVCFQLSNAPGAETMAAGSDRLPPPIERKVDFVSHIQPIFARACYSCHGPERQRADLRLDVKAVALEGGASGPVILPGKSAESRLIQLVAGMGELFMPEQGDPLSAEEIGWLRAWIDQGADWPDGLEPEDYLERQSHWAFEPLVRPDLPALEDLFWSRNPIDHFILARLEEAQLKPSEEADRTTLIRRLYFNLIGLPPSPEEVNAFLSDNRPDAYERLVEDLLASPHYGERWARHWLDVVRFAESTGFETNLERKNAWPYRDYVIRAFNEDKPYQQFIREQLAGEALGADAATGFLVGGPYDVVKSPDINLTLMQRSDELADIIHTTGTAFLGLTVGCARCHNHKFDPISQVDYYAMQAVFAGVRHAERPVPPPDEVERRLEIERLKELIAAIENDLTEFEPLAHPDLEQPSHTPNPRRNVEEFEPVAARSVRFTIQRTADGLEPCLDELEIYSAADDSRNVALASAGAIATASSVYPNSEIHKLEHIHDGRTGNSYSWISNERGRGWVQLEFPEPVLINRIVWSRDREGKFKDRLATRYDIEVRSEEGAWQAIAGSHDREPLQSNGSSSGTIEEQERFTRLLETRRMHQQRIDSLNLFPAIYAGRFEEPEPTHRLHRGEPLQKREVVPPGGIKGIGPDLELPEETPEQARRLAFAEWIVHPDNPLTARVLVNRLWQYHFGEGIVGTSSDLGVHGARPTHPELLDWLAAEFVARDWSLKTIQRLIVRSSTFRQSSRPDSAALARDAGTRLLWRFPPRRLEAEPIRDIILWASGKLDLTMGGPGFHLFVPNDNYVRVYVSKTGFGPEEWRRMIYQWKPRMELDDTFGAFDCPDAGQATAKRNQSTTPLQALNLLNSPFLLEQAAFFAERLQARAGPGSEDQIREAFRLLFSRDPTPAERERSLKLIEEHGLEIFCRALFNTNELIYVF
jgi:hypothetical protein